MSEKQPTKIPGQAPGNEKEIERWHDYHRSVQEETPKRLEEAAKVLTGVIALTFTLLLGNDALKGSGGGEALTTFKKLSTLDGTLLAVSTGLWLLSLLLAFLVVFPRRYRYVSRSSEAIRDMHERTVRWKYGLLVAAAALYLVALGLAAWVYLQS